MALTIYEGIKDDQLVDEDIDEVILRLLGLEDINDLDYDTYKTLLKERMMAGRMTNNTIPSQETEKLTEEYKRVKRETGRFKVKKKPIKKDSFTPPDVSRGTRTRRSDKRLGGSEPSQKFLPTRSKADEVEDIVTEKQESSMQVMDFLTRIVAPSLSKIEASLANILASQTSEQKAQKKAAESARKGTEKAKSRDKEEGFESAIFKKLGDGAKAIAKPFSGIFDAIWKFVKNIVLGIGALKLIEFFKDPSKIFRDIGNMMIGAFNDILKGVFFIIYSPLNLFVNMLNGILNEFEYSINETIGKIPGIPELKLPDIPNFEAPQIPKIPEPEKPESTPAPAMAGGGEVTNVTNKYYQLMEGGGKVRTDSGDKVTGAGPDTQLVALQPGEFVMSKGAVDAYGADTLLGMNAAAGGTNSPKMARVQSASGGGLIPAMQGGGVVEHLHGEPGRSGYREDHGTESQAHDHYAFSSESLRKKVQQALAAGEGPSGRKYQVGSTTGGKHANTSYHYSGQAFDIPWSQFGSGAIGKKDFQQSRTLDKDVRALVAKFGGSGGGGQTQVDPQESVTGTSSRKSKDYWALAAIMSVEASNAQGRADVATSIMNRAASGGVYTGAPSIHALVNATNQYEPVRKGDPKLWSEIRDRESAIKALNSVPYVRGQGSAFISEATAVLSNQGLMDDAAKFVGPRTDFSTPSAMGVHQYRDKHRSKEASRHGHVFGFFVGPGAVELGTKKFGAGAGATSMEDMNMSSGDSGGQQPGQPSTSPTGRPNLPQSQVHQRNFNFSDVTIPDQPSSQRPRIRPPLTGGSGGGGGTSVVVPSSSGGGAGSQQAPTSSSGGHQSESPMFSPIDQNNPELLVVKSIYNIVG